MGETQEGGTMNEYEIIALFCHLDDFCKAHKLHDSRREMTDSEVLLTALIAARAFRGNLSLACKFLKENKYCPHMLSKSRFNRRIHQFPEWLWLEVMKTFCFERNVQEHIVDSFPIQTCRMARRYRSNLFVGDQYLGYNAAHKQWYVGLKVHLISTAKGNPLSFIISPGSEHDLTALKIMEIPLGRESILYGDKAYTDYEWEEELKAERDIELIAQRKSNSKRRHPEKVEKRRAKVRKFIETAISGIIRLMPRWIQAVTAKGFELKLVLFVVGFASLQLAT